MPDDRPLNRRRFFREGLRELLKPLADAVDPLERTVRGLSRLEEPAAGRRVPLRVWLRPPGALPEAQFLDACSRCGECVKVCPAQCIRIDPLKAKGDGAPYIDIDHMPCVVCDSLACMHHCPSGALVPTPIGDIDMGTAVWHAETCVRTTGEECTTCVDQCPLGSAAIELREGKIHVIDEGCIGCGVCQFYCPTTPKSITIIPAAQTSPPAPGEHGH